MNGILELVSNVFRGVWTWMTSYGAKDVKESRIIKDEKNEQDEFNKALHEKNIEKVRADLSGGA